MRYKAFASMNIAIIGNEKTTAVLAQGLALAQHEILIGIKEHENVFFDFLVDEFENINITTIDYAACQADLIIMATTADEVREASYLLDDVRKKVIIDATSMDLSRTGNYVNTLSAIKSITGSQNVVKCFNAAGFDPSGNRVGIDNAIQMFIAGDDKKAKEMAKFISRDLGFAECHDFGSSDSVPLLDEMAICYHNLAARKEQGEKISIKITKR